MSQEFQHSLNKIQYFVKVVKKIVFNIVNDPE